MLKFRVDNSESRKQLSESATTKDTAGRDGAYEDAVPYNSSESSAQAENISPDEIMLTEESQVSTASQNLPSEPDPDSIYSTAVPADYRESTSPESVIDHALESSVEEGSNTVDLEQTSSLVVNNDQTSLEPVSEDIITPCHVTKQKTSIPGANQEVKRGRGGSDEHVLHESIIGSTGGQTGSATLRSHKWSIPDTDSDDESAEQDSWAATKAPGLSKIITDKPASSKFNLPCDSEEEEDPYSMVKSPSLSIKSAEPPIPPPVSTIPRTHRAEKHANFVQDSSVPTHTGSATEQPITELRKKLTVNPLVGIKKISMTSTSDIDPYDEIDYDKIDNHSKSPVKEGQSEPRFQFTLSKSRVRLNPAEKLIDDTYAEIPRRIPWNFPSSSEEDEEDQEPARNKKLNNVKVQISRQDSSSSEEGDKPLPPAKMWESEEGACATPIEEGAVYRRGSGDSGIREAKSHTSVTQDDITIEYSALKRTDVSKKGSLLGPDDNELELNADTSPAFSHSSGFEENVDDIDTLSVQSEDSSKIVTDYEQSSTCVDMDQLSLDSSGKRPKRIVETHETHEIVPADNNEDDIVERIIETRTITEKLDDNHTFKDYSGEDYSRYLHNDDEFVSHIFSVGRTLEKVSKQKKTKDFAFVENPFSVPEPVIETMPLEKKTTTTKVTTLRKKKKNQGDENLYAEVQMKEESTGSSEQGNASCEDEIDDYDHTITTDSLRHETMRWTTGNEAGASNSNTAQDMRQSAASNDSGALIYESVFDIGQDNDFSQHPITDKKKETKSEKKSLFKGFKKLLKKKDKTVEACKVDPSVLDDDYQEFVP